MSSENEFELNPDPDPVSAADDLTDGALERLDPRVVPCEEVGSWIFTGVVGVVMAVSSALIWANDWVEPAVGWWLVAAQTAVLVVLVCATRVAPRWTYRFTGYAVTERGIEIRRGRFWRSVVSVPCSRVQHTDVSQGPIQRRFGLGTIKIHTAGSEHAEVQLGGLEHGTACLIRDFLVGWSERDGV